MTEHAAYAAGLTTSSSPQTFSFPQLGSYRVPLEALLKRVFPYDKVMPPPAITQRTLELGSRYSPDFVCVPFKYTLGSYIEALENGATVLFQAGGGCRYGYYAEVQERILKDMGYRFTFVKLLRDSVNPLSLYRACRALGSPLSFPRFAYGLLLVVRMIEHMDAFEAYVREHVGFECKENSFRDLHKAFLNRLSRVATLPELHAVTRAFDRRLKALTFDRPMDCLKVGIVGELFVNMEPFSNYFLEKELARRHIRISRFINVTFLLFQKARRAKRTLKGCAPYLKYAIGADGTDSVANSLRLAKEGADGIIHIKPFGCTPEVNAMPILQNIACDYHIPILYFSFDSQTSEAGVKTRLEAFYDMLEMKKWKVSRE